MCFDWGAVIDPKRQADVKPKGNGSSTLSVSVQPNKLIMFESKLGMDLNVKWAGLCITCKFKPRDDMG